MDPVDQLQLLCSEHREIGVWWPSFSLASAIITALLAPSRGRSALGWFFIGGVLPWISIAVLYVLRDLTPFAFAHPGPRPAPASGPPLGPGQAADPARWTSVSEPGAALPQDGWFYALRRQAMGPVSLPYLRSAIEMGTIGRDVPVWCSAFRDWVTPNRIPGFFG